MQKTMRVQEFAVGKLDGRSIKATVDNDLKISRLFVTDKSTGRDFLVDTGADISVIPPNHREKGNAPCLFKLFAANGSQIKTFGNKTVTLNLGLRRPIRWIFVIADITHNRFRFVKKIRPFDRCKKQPIKRRFDQCFNRRKIPANLPQY